MVGVPQAASTWWSARARPRTLVELLLRGEVKDAEAFTDKARLMELIRPLREAGARRGAREGRGARRLRDRAPARRQRPDARGAGRRRASWRRPEYKALYSTYEEFRELDQPPLTVGRTAARRRWTSREALLTTSSAEGKRGVTIQRYKGLGEMNAEQLWESTMDPATRTLLQVQLEDEEVAENIFTTLMGDAVEPRRLFIEENALNVRNLDI